MVVRIVRQGSTNVSPRPAAPSPPLPWFILAKGNRIARISPDMGGLLQLQRLVLCRNSIQELPETIGLLTKCVLNQVASTLYLVVVCIDFLPHDNRQKLDRAQTSVKAALHGQYHVYNLLVSRFTIVDLGDSSYPSSRSLTLLPPLPQLPCGGCPP